MIVEQPDGAINLLDDKAIGRTVYYIPNHAKNDQSQWERGRIKSYDNERRVAWVVYDNGNDAKVEHYDRYTATCTDYDQLKFERKL